MNRNIRKIVSLVLVLSMVFTISVQGFAAEGTDNLSKQIQFLIGKSRARDINKAMVNP